MADSLTNTLFNELQQFENAVPAPPVALAHGSVGKRNHISIEQGPPTLSSEVTTKDSGPSKKKSKADNETDAIIDVRSLYTADVLVEREGFRQTFSGFMQDYLAEKTKTYLKIQDTMVSCKAGQLLNPADVSLAATSRIIYVATFSPSTRFLLQIKEDQLCFPSRVELDLFFKSKIIQVKARLTNLGVEDDSSEQMVAEFVSVITSRCTIVTVPFYC